VTTTSGGDLANIAAAIDRAGAEPTLGRADRYLAALLPPLIVDPLIDPAESEVWTTEQHAAALAFGYRLQHVTDTGRDRVELVAFHTLSGGEERPPRVCAIESAVVDVWEQLAASVTSFYGIARLEHLLFQARRGNGFTRGKRWIGIHDCRTASSTEDQGRTAAGSGSG
jgi:hypothetical protein